MDNDGVTELSPKTLDTHRYWHTVWNLSALVMINFCNFLWLHRTIYRGVNYWSDLLCDVAMAAYQLCETAVDVRCSSALARARVTLPAQASPTVVHHPDGPT